jgi:hypothetical protein
MTAAQLTTGTSRDTNKSVARISGNTISTKDGNNSRDASNSREANNSRGAAIPGTPEMLETPVT